MSKIILAYSEHHFNPITKKVIDGTGIISHSLWNYLNEIYIDDEIIFTDHQNFAKFVGVTDVKLLIGLSPNFHKFVEAVKPDISILWAVNKSAVERRRIQITAKEKNIPVNGLNMSDGLFSNIYETQNVDYVITLGGWSNYQSYVERGLDSNSVYAIGIGNLENRVFEKYRGGENIIFFIGNLSFRKGAHLIAQILKLLKARGKRKLIVIGTSSTKFWRDQLNDLIKLYPNNLIYVAKRLDFNSSEWEELVKSSQFAVFPSFEEGIAGTAIDIIMSGLPLLYSNEVGLEFTENTPILTMDSDDEWLNAIEKMISLTKEARHTMLMEQQNLLALNGENIPQIRNILKRIESGRLWPVIKFSNSIEEYQDFTKLTSEFSQPEYLITNEFLNKNENMSVPKIICRGNQVLTEEEICRLGVMTLDRFLPINKLNAVSESNNLNFLIESLIPSWQVNSKFNANKNLVLMANLSSYEKFTLAMPKFLQIIVDLVFKNTIYRYKIRNRNLLRFIIQKFVKK